MTKRWMPVLFAILTLGSPLAYGGDRSPRLSVDRFEGENKEIAVLVASDLELQVNFPREFLPKSARGGVLVYSVKGNRGKCPRVEATAEDAVRLAIDLGLSSASSSADVPKSFLYEGVKVGDVVCFRVDWRATQKLREETRRLYEELELDPSNPS